FLLASHRLRRLHSFPTRRSSDLLARTVMTGITTLLVLFALFYWGGEDFYSFTISLIIGIVVGTYSTIFVATIVSLMLGLKREDLLPLKESAPVDDMP